MTEERPKWWPDRENWPTFPPEPPYEIKGETYIDRLGVEEALALLLLEEYVVPLNAAPDVKEGRCGLFVQCSDVFYSASADAEPLPAVGFADDPVFWDLYDLVREHGWPGAMRWCALRREIRPMEHWCDLIRAAGLWDEKIAALPDVLRNYYRPDPPGFEPLTEEQRANNLLVNLGIVR
jgi:hypothetical protein